MNERDDLQQPQQQPSNIGTKIWCAVVLVLSVWAGIDHGFVDGFLAVWGAGIFIWMLFMWLWGLL